MTEIVKKLAEDYGFIVVPNKDNKNIDHIIFDNGRQYKFQHPSFMEFHETIFESEKSLEQTAFLYGLSLLFSENDKSPKINETYLNANYDEALYLWSPLLRGLLLRS